MVIFSARGPPRGATGAHARTAPRGGVLALMGDDHTCESSTTAHQSEFAMVNTMVPILSPAGVQGGGSLALRDRRVAVAIS